MAEPKFTATTVKNTAQGPRGLHAKDGPVLLEPNEVRKLELSDAELASAKSTGHFEIPAKDADDKKADDKTES